jgi:hypothetical protein
MSVGGTFNISRASDMLASSGLNSGGCWALFWWVAIYLKYMVPEFELASVDELRLSESRFEGIGGVLPRK